MKHSEVLSRYVNTGGEIPEKQFNRLTPVLKKSYLRMRGVAGNYFEWEFKIISDDERIKYIEKKGEELTYNDINNLLKYSDNKDIIATKIFQIKGEKLNDNDTYYLLHYSENKDDITTKIINVKGEYLTYNDINNLLKYSDNKDIIATKIIEKKGVKLNYNDINNLLKYSHNKELINKTLLQNGVDYNLINKVITTYNIDTPLIPDNYQSMLNEIRRIKEIMK